MATSESQLVTLLRLAWPVVLARATQGVVGFCDALMVSPLGEAPLAATTTGSLNTYAFMILPVGTAFIVQSFAAQLRGRGDLEAVRRYAWYGLVLAAAAAVIALVATPFLPRLVRLFGYAPEVERLMTAYISIRLLSVAAVVGTEALGNWYGGLGNTRLSMIAGVVTMVTNVAANWLLIEPRFGLPGYGVAGAAWASALASWLGFAVVLAAFVRGYGYQRIGPLGRLRTSELVRVLRFGIPNGINWFLEFAAFVLFINVVVGHLGTTVLAAFNVVMQLNSLAFMPAFGLATAGSILVGEAIGRGAKSEVWPIVRMTGAVASLWMGSVAILYFSVPVTLTGIFRPRDTSADELLALGAKMLAMSAFWQLFDALSMTLSEALRAAGDTAWCMTARIVLAWVMFTPAAWAAVLVFGGGVTTVMVSLIAYVGILAAAFSFRFASGRWKEIDLVGAEPTLV